MRRLMMTAAAATAAALALTACGTTEPAADSDDAMKAGEAITLTDASGKKVELDGPAKKVVGTEWHEVELLKSPGVDPVGVADVKGCKTWDQAVPLKNEPVDIGTRGEPRTITGSWGHPCEAP